ncbi:MAG: circadian clock protein KaiC, partial [Leptolyngbya sp. SIO4C5]|nr:circadian clock protein KaiC [Leptolyngbya sp. SIO4C5]
STATLFAQNFMRQGAKASFFLFDELVHTLKQRSAGLGMDLAPFIEQDQVRFHEINLNGITPGRLLNRIRRDVIDWGAKLVIIDTLTGYFNSMPSEQYLLTQMHELLLFLSRQGVLSFLVVAQHGVVGSNLEVPVDISYLADTVLLLRHFEAEGSLRQAISVYKKRYGSHEKRIRALNFQPNGIQVGEPLSQFTGILSGMPNYVGKSRQLFQTDD